MRESRNRFFERFKDEFKILGTSIYLKGTYAVMANVNSFNAQPARLLEVHKDTLELQGKVIVDTFNSVLSLVAFFQALNLTTLYKAYEVTDILPVERNIVALNPVTKMVENKRLKLIGTGYFNKVDNLRTMNQELLSRRSAVMLTNFPLEVGDIIGGKYKVSALFFNAGLWNAEVEYGN